MPNYDYECLNCGENFEVFQRMSDLHLEECPKCKGRVRRLIGSGCGLIFKGSGFYITDYKKKQPPSGVKNGPGKQCSGRSQSSCSQAESKK